MRLLAVGDAMITLTGFPYCPPETDLNIEQGIIVTILENLGHSNCRVSKMQAPATFTTVSDHIVLEDAVGVGVSCPIPGFSENRHGSWDSTG